MSTNSGRNLIYNVKRISNLLKSLLSLKERVSEAEALSPNLVIARPIKISI